MTKFKGYKLRTFGDSVYKHNFYVIYKNDEYYQDFIKEVLLGTDEDIERIKLNMASTWLQKNYDAKLRLCTIFVFDSEFIDCTLFEKIGFISHESFHAATTLLEFLGTEYRLEGTNEPYAYYIEFIARRLAHIVL